MRIASLFILFFASSVFGQNVEIKLNDHSIVRGVLSQDKINLKTLYGDLTIPCKDIRTLDLGFHVPKETETKIKEFMEKLENPSYNIRQESQKQLVNLGRYSIPFLEKNKDSKNLEIAMRSTACLKEIEKEINLSDITTKEYDEIITDDNKLTGKITNATIKLKHQVFGEVDLSIFEIKSLTNLSMDQELDITPVVTPGYTNECHWVDTKIKVHSGNKLKIAATGMLSYDGNNTVGPSGTATTENHGALMGQIGSGSPFIIGTDLHMVSPESGMLKIRIISFPGNSSITGRYNVNIKTH